jgi:hypothetical protein
MRLGVTQEIPEEMPIVGVHGMVKSLRELARVAGAETRQPVYDLGVIHRGGLRGRSAPVVTDQQRGLSTALVDEIADVGGELIDVVRIDAVWPR